MRSLFLGLAVAASALVSSPAMADDTQIADFIQSRLQVDQQQGRLRGFNVDLQVEDGTVLFKGYVSTPEQEQLILPRSGQSCGQHRSPTGFEASRLSVDFGFASATTSCRLPAATDTRYSCRLLTASRFRWRFFDAIATSRFRWRLFDTIATSRFQRRFVDTTASIGVPYSGEVITGEVISGDPLPFATAGAPAPGPSGGAGFAAPSGSPNLPGYAWPGYAARSNFGAVSYPRQYSASAWPFIGPFYPYPQVPLGWRKVSLEWDDGFWFLDFSDKSRH